MYLVATKCIHQPNGQATIELTKSPLHLKVSQENHINESFYEVNKHSSFVAPTSIETGKNARHDSEDHDSEQTYLGRKLLLQVEHRTTKGSRQSLRNNSSKCKQLLVSSLS